MEERWVSRSPAEPENVARLQERADRDGSGQRPVAVVDDGCGRHGGHVTCLPWGHLSVEREWDIIWSA